MKNLIPAVLSLLLLAGCGEAGVESASFNLPEKATHELRELFYIAEPVDGMFFDKIWNIHVLRDGNLIVQNYFETQLFELSPEGELVKMIGREGRGPGEFQQIHDTYLLGDDSLHVVERNHRRHQVMVKTEENRWVQHRERTFIWGRPGSPNENVPEQVITGPDDAYMGIFPIYASLTDSVEGHNNYYMARVNHNLAQTSPMSRVRRVEDIAGIRSPSFFRGFYNYNPARDEVFYITNTSNAIVAIDSVGDERVSGHLPFDRFPARRDSALEAILAPIREYGMFTTELQTATEQTLLAHEPYYWRVVFDQAAGRLWVNLARSDGGPNWVVTNLEGEVLYSFYGPRFIRHYRKSIVVAKGNRLYGAIVDSNGVEYMGGYELVEIGE